MKKLSNITFAAILLGGVQLLQTGCTDMEGDGIGSIEWGGSTNVEAVSYHNPVWEPSLEGGTLVVTSTNFVAIGGETQWAVGVDYCCPSIYSSTSMIWETNQQVSFTAANRPKWISGRINSLSVDYCTVSEEITVDDAETTVSASRYFMAYSTDKDDAIGIASSVSAQGPYVDHGCLLTASSLGAGSLRDPFVMATDANEIYIGYTSSEGSYVQKIRIPYSVTSSNGIVFDAAALPKLDGEPVKVDFWSCRLRISLCDGMMRHGALSFWGGRFDVDEWGSVYPGGYGVYRPEQCHACHQVGQRVLVCCLQCLFGVAIDYALRL